jgi:hypothetical protein
MPLRIYDTKSAATDEQNRVFSVRGEITTRKNSDFSSPIAARFTTYIA